jgi:hypothetical protein
VDDITQVLELSFNRKFGRLEDIKLKNAAIGVLAATGLN